MIATLFVAPVAALGVRHSSALAGVSENLPPTVASAWDGEAACLAPARLNATSMRARLNALLAGAPRTSAVIAGFTIEDEPEPLVKALRALAPVAPSGLARRGQCHKVACAASAIFGADAGLRLLFLRLRYGYNGSYLAAPGAQPWTVGDLDVALAALGDLPGNLAPFDGRTRLLAHENDLPLFQHPVSARWREPPVAASGPKLGGILIGGAWAHGGYAERRASLFHELAHEFAASRAAGFDWRSAWREAMALDADWARKVGAPSSAVSLYAGASLDEDFAESATAYRYLPAQVGMRAPHRYALLRDWMFDGLQYFSPDQCHPGLARSEQARLVADARLSGMSPRTVEPAAVAGGCRAANPGAANQDAGRACIVRRLFAAEFTEYWLEPPAKNSIASDYALQGFLADPAFVARAMGPLATDPHLAKLGPDSLAAANPIAGGP